MAQSVNRVELIGRVGSDPEIRQAGNSDVANFRVATSETWKDKRSGEKQEKTEWHSIVVWQEGTIKFIEQYVKKGDLIRVEGKIETRKWQDKDGNDRYSTEIVVPAFGGGVILLASKDGANDNNRGGSRGRDDDDRGSRGGSRGRGRDDDDRGSSRGRGRDDDRDDDRGGRGRGGGGGRSSSRGRDDDDRGRSSARNSGGSSRKEDLDDDIPF